MSECTPTDMRILHYSTAIPFMRNCLADIVEKATIDNEGDGYMLNALVVWMLSFVMQLSYVKRTE